MTQAGAPYELADEVIHDLGVVLGTIDSTSEIGSELYSIVERALDEASALQERVESGLEEETETAGA